MGDKGTAATGKGVFISYRRGETSGQARALHDRLVQRFGAPRVFMDVDSIAPGADFVQKIEEAIDSSGVELMLIGHDWLTRGQGVRAFDDPADYIRLEAVTALERGVPIVPILVERARMPSPEELPEPLRPITRRNALELENQRWEYDVSRLVGAVERLIDPDGSDGDRNDDDRNDGERDGDDEHGRRGGRHRPSKRRWLLVGVALALVAGAASGIAVAVSSHGPPPKPQTRLTATNAVDAVPPERLVVALLTDGLGSNVPSQLSAAGQHLLAIRMHGLFATVYVDLSPVSTPLVGSYVDYELFDSRADAYAFFTSSKPFPAGDTYTGHFTSTGIADPTRCDTSVAPASSGQEQQWTSSCDVLSGKAISFVELASSSKSVLADDRLASALTADAVRQLARLAAATPTSAPGSPPGALSPQALFEQVLTSPFPDTLLPEGVSNPSSHDYSYGSNAPSGLIAGSYIYVGFSGPDYRDNLYYDVFDTAQDAKAWFNTGLQPSGFTAVNSIDSSGFSQPASCGTYSVQGHSSGPVTGISACYVLDGDVVIAAQTSSTTDGHGANNDLAVTLARAAILNLDQLDG